MDLMDKIKLKFPDAIVFVGGDFNNKKLDRFLNAFPDLKPVCAGATRGGGKHLTKCTPT